MADEVILAEGNDEEIKKVLTEEEQAALDNADGPKPAEGGDKKVEDTKVEETPAEDEPPAKEEPTDYNEYEEPSLKHAVNILREAKIPVSDTNAWFDEAVKTGDMTKIDRAAMTEALGKEKADLVLVLAESYYNTTFTKFKNLEKDAHAIVGGEETYKSMQAWAAKQTDPAVLKDIQEMRELLDTGKPKAIKAAVTEWYNLYKADPTTTTKATLLKGDSAPNGNSVEPLSRLEYTKAVQLAHRKGTYEQERQSLWARREAAITQNQ